MRRTFEAEIGKESNILCAFLTLCQRGKDEKSSPSLAAIYNANRLPANSQVVHVAFGNIPTPHDANGANAFECEVDKRQDDADAKDPLGYVKGNGGLNGRTPAVKGEELVGGEAID